MKLKPKEIVWWSSDEEDDIKVAFLNSTVERELERKRPIPTLIDLYIWACDGLGIEPIIPPKIKITYESDDGDHFIIIYPDQPNIPYSVNDTYFYDGEDEDDFDEDAYDDCHFYRDIRYLELWRIRGAVERNVKKTDVQGTIGDNVD